MLACARLGAVHSVVFGGFAAHELAVRIDDAKPKLVLSSSCGIEGERVIPYKPLLDDAVAQASHKPAVCLIHQRPQVGGCCRVDERDGERERERVGCVLVGWLWWSLWWRLCW
jgi:propionyl-CoA synthetase